MLNHRQQVLSHQPLTDCTRMDDIIWPIRLKSAGASLGKRWSKFAAGVHMFTLSRSGASIMSWLHAGIEFSLFEVLSEDHLGPLCMRLSDNLLNGPEAQIDILLGSIYLLGRDRFGRILMMEEARHNVTTEKVVQASAGRWLRGIRN